MRYNILQPKEEPKPFKFELKKVCLSEGDQGYEIQQYEQNKNKYGRYNFKQCEEEKKEQSLEQKVDMLVEENKKLLQTTDSLKSEIERLTNLYSEQEFVPETKKESTQKVKKM